MTRHQPVVIDGRQLSGETGGVQRFIKEILRELDKISNPGDYEVLVPESANALPHYNNIKIIHYGKLNGLLWEQICLPRYLWIHHTYGVFPCTIVPILYPKGLAIVHDVMIAKLPELKASIKNPLALQMLLLNYRVAAKRATVLATVSEHSRTDIAQLYGKQEDTIEIIGNGWQHIKRIKSDESWKESHPEIKPGNYFFSLSANRKQKNFKWIFEVAKRTPQMIFAIAGCQEEWQKQEEYDAPNIKHLGYVSDEQIRSLIENCKAFLFPSIYEGFGIPPMEALALGANVVVARSSCLPEIYRDSVHYIDPYDYEVDLLKLLETPVAPASEVLNRYGWDISAKKLHDICSSYFS